MPETRRLRILWIKVGGLWPPDRGGRLRSFHLLRELARRHEVTLLTTHGPDDDPEQLAARLPDGTRVVSTPYRPPKKGSARFLLTVLRSWIALRPADVFKFRVPALAREARRLLRAGAVDLCVADFLSATANLPARGAAPVLLFEHNVEHLIWKGLARLDRSFWRRRLLAIEWRLLRRHEARSVARAALTVAVSELDRARLMALAPGAAVETVPTGVDTAQFQPGEAAEAPGSIAFVGSMDWHPNEDAVRHCLRAILPRIRAAVPGASLTVIGRNPSSGLREAARSAGVEVTGTVPDVRPYLARAAVVVVPLRIGGGTRLKIFEALAMAKAVVSTTIGAEGLPVTPGVHFVQTDDETRFAEEVAALLGDPERRRRFGEAGRRLVESRYAWPQVALRFEALCRAAAGPAPRPEETDPRPAGGPSRQKATLAQPCPGLAASVARRAGALSARPGAPHAVQLARRPGGDPLRHPLDPFRLPGEHHPQPDGRRPDAPRPGRARRGGAADRVRGAAGGAGTSRRPARDPGRFVARPRSHRAPSASRDARRGQRGRSDRGDGRSHRGGAARPFPPGRRSDRAAHG